ncbi:nuclear transport factor 2 family protein [Glycomyces tenuis]|uniref:Rv0361 family membrane protein n=1 Tax=Glycomyces tenuis TaxID=58116 RepID=UPI00041EFB9E|nr:nuclear transport factor 2 family protein [Glycomyces tenuis]
MSTHSKLGSARRAAAVVGGAFATALVLAACGGNADSPDAAVENFYDNGAEDFLTALSEGDFDELADVSEDYFCAEDVADIRTTADEMKTMTDEELDAMVGSMPEFGDVSFEVEILETSEEGDTATVEAEVTGPDFETGEESTETTTMELVKEDDEWRLCGEFL